MKLDLDHFRARILQDALAEATAHYWLRRADQFAAVGNPACDEIATACRNHAKLLAEPPTTIDPDVWAAVTNPPNP